MSSISATTNNDSASITSNEPSEQVNLGEIVPPLETFNCGNSGNNNLSSQFIKPENPCLCHICGLHFGDNVSFNVHYRQCYAYLMSGTYNYGYPYGMPQSYNSCRGDIPINIDDNRSNECIGNNPNIKNETKWLCEHCPMAFEYKRDKIKHEYSHTGDKPFGCVYCAKKWKNKTALKRHMHTHTGEKPYECNWCEKRYTQSTLLKNHCEKTHGMLVKFKKGKAIQTGNVNGNGNIM